MLYISSADETLDQVAAADKGERSGGFWWALIGCYRMMGLKVLMGLFWTARQKSISCSKFFHFGTRTFFL
jgi:hypothetical protein